MPLVYVAGKNSGVYRCNYSALQINFAAAIFCTCNLSLPLKIVALANSRATSMRAWDLVKPIVCDVAGFSLSLWACRWNFQRLQPVAVMGVTMPRGITGMPRGHVTYGVGVTMSRDITRGHVQIRTFFLFFIQISPPFFCFYESTVSL